MSFESIVLLIVLIPTFIILLLKILFKNSNSKFANIINKLWDEWFEDQYNTIYSTVILFIILIVIIIIVAGLFN